MPILLHKTKQVEEDKKPEETLTADQVKIMIAERDAEWSLRLENMAKSVMNIVSKLKLNKDQPVAELKRKPVRVKFEVNSDGMPIGFTINQEK
jgi:hypothetical protein